MGLCSSACGTIYFFVHFEEQWWGTHVHVNRCRTQLKPSKTCPSLSLVKRTWPNSTPPSIRTFPLRPQGVLTLTDHRAGSPTSWTPYAGQWFLSSDWLPSIYPSTIHPSIFSSDHSVISTCIINYQTTSPSLQPAKWFSHLSTYVF